MTTYHSFDETEVQALIDTAAKHHAQVLEMVRSEGAEATLPEASVLRLGDVCITVEVADGRICLNLPIIKKKVCLPIPGVPNGTAAKACLKVCTILGLPTGVCVTVTVLGKTVVQQCFGKC